MEREGRSKFKKPVKLRKGGQKVETAGQENEKNNRYGVKTGMNCKQSRKKSGINDSTNGSVNDSANGLRKEKLKSIREVLYDTEELDKIPLSDKADDNKSMLKEIFKDCSDVVFREFYTGTGEKRIKALAIFTDGLVEKRIINDNVLEPLINEAGKKEADEKCFTDYFEFVYMGLLTCGETEVKDKTGDVVNGILSGEEILFIDGFAKAITVSVPGWKTRSISEPLSETVVRGPREGFNETIRINTALLRRRIKSPGLKIENMTIGTLTKTTVIIAYEESLVNREVLDKVKKRLQKIKIDAVLESAYIEEFIEDRPFSLFPQMRYTERPDTAAYYILEGRIIIMVDGTPFCLIVPSVFSDFIEVIEDYYERFYFASFIRILRYIFFFVALLAPAILIAATTFHHEMLPTQLLISIAQARAGVPFPAFIEVLLMEITFEALREAGIRLPRAVGQAVSIVGALVVGEAAVSAGIVSNVTVIVVALTGIASFTIPAYNMSIPVRLCRFIFILLSAGLGFFGIITGLIVLLIHLVGLESFGIPYLSPIAPSSFADMKGDIIRLPKWMLDFRPKYIQKRNVKKQANNLMPKPPANQ